MTAELAMTGFICTSLAMTGFICASLATPKGGFDRVFVIARHEAISLV